MLLCYGGECGPLWPRSAWAVLPGANPECRVCLCTCNAIFCLEPVASLGNSAPERPEEKQLCELGQGHLSAFPFVLKKGPTAFNKDCCCLGDVASCFLTALQLEKNQIFLPFTAVWVVWEIWSAMLANSSGNLILWNAVWLYRCATQNVLNSLLPKRKQVCLKSHPPITTGGQKL